MKLRLIGVFGLLFACFLVGCATPPPSYRIHHAHFTDLADASAQRPLKVLFLPPDITASEVSAGGVVEKVPAWSELATANIGQAVKIKIESMPAVDLISMPDMTASEKAVLDAHLALYDVVGGDAFFFSRIGADAWAHKAHHFDYTLGGGLAFLKEKTDADAGLIITGQDQDSTTGRKVVAYLWGGPAMLGHSFVSCGLVDLKTGDIMWLNYAFSLADKHIRDAAGATEMIDALFKEFPGIDVYRRYFEEKYPEAFK